MSKAIELRVTGIKCDAKGCDYEDNDAKFENYEQYLNKPCPKCGATLLTQEDLDTVKYVIEAVDSMNDIFDPISGDPKYVTTEIDMCGDGSATIKLPGEKS